MRKTLLLWLVLTLSWSNFFCAQAGAAEVKDASEYRYAVTLLSSFSPIPDAMLPRGIPDHVYRTQASVFGQTIYFVRQGFYASAGEAEAAKERFLKRYPAALVTRITPDEYLKVTGGEPVAPKTSATPQTTSTPPPVAPAAKASIPVPTVPAAPVVPLVTPTPVITKPAEQPAPASTVTQKSVTPAPAPAPVASSSIEQQAGELMKQARDALTRNDDRSALSILGQLLRLPPNSQSQDAQELIGVAQERLGHKTSALQEYALYLRLYPEGPGADRVRQRMASLEAPPARMALKKPERPDIAVSSFRGSLSQYYYHGQSQIDSTTTVLGPTTETSLTNTDQSALYNNLDMRGRYSSGSWDNSLVIRDTYTASFLENTENTNRLYSAYYELNNKVDEYSGRFGRQPGSSGGVLGTFDGVTLGYNLFPKWRINVIAGIPVNFYSVNYNQQFWGTSVDFGLFAEHWNGNAYYIQQTVDGIADRQAIGTELRYFDQKGSALLYVDYDLLFSSLNIATFQATWRTTPSTTINGLIDHRLAPTLMTSNALFSAPSGSTIDSLLTTMTEEQLRQQAVANSPTFDTYMLGVTQNINTTWQIGGDVRHFSLSAPPSSPTITTTLSSGDSMMYSAQTIANGLFRKRDLTVLTLSYLDGATYQSETLSINQRMLFQDRWTLDLTLSYSMQTDEPVLSLVGTDTHSTQNDTDRIATLVRLGYNWGKNLVLESEVGLDSSARHSVDTNITTPGTPDLLDTTTKRRYFMLGYRWNF